MLMSCLDGNFKSVSRNITGRKTALMSALNDVNQGLQIAREKCDESLWQLVNLQTFVLLWNRVPYLSIKHEINQNFFLMMKLMTIIVYLKTIFTSPCSLPKPFHSCETALLRVQNDILQAIDNRSCVALLLLDLSAAFDTVDHKILLKRLHSKFGIRGNALSWFRSYLSDRTQFASLDGASSETLQLDCGSVLGPILYLFYTLPVADLLRKHNMSFHLYADDTQLYIPFSCNDDFSLDQATKLIENCVTDIDNWMTLNKLKLNKDKTEFLHLSSKHNPQRSLPVLLFGSDLITPSPKARNIGVTFDSTLSMVPHINNICKSSFYHLRNISRIRKYISVKTTETLVHAFISSKLDHCNSVLFGLPKNLIDKLQAVQNASARLIINTQTRPHHTCPH